MNVHPSTTVGGRYRAFGLTIRSDIELPELAPADPVTTGEDEVRILCGSINADLDGAQRLDAALAGPSGAGKSTLAACFQDRGRAVLSDDVCAVTFDATGQARVAPGLARIKLWGDTLTALGRDRAELDAIADDTDKFSLPIGRLSAASAPLKRLYILDPDGAPAATCTRLAGLEAVNAVLSNIYRWPLATAMGRAAHQFAQVARLVGTCEIVSLRYPRGFDALPDVMRRLDGAPTAAEECARVLNAQAIYGPHASGHWNGDDITLGRRLFRLLPEDHHDTQPLVGASGVVLVADVRLDNRAELQAALGVGNARAGALCDAGLLLAAWERWGDACFDHIIGVYAFAVWEPSKQRLILARDPLGQRPLHYHRTAGRLVFASMPTGVHAVADGPPAPDEARLAEFLALAPRRGPRSFYRDVERVEPGALLIVDQTSTRSQTHWSPRGSSGARRRDDIVEGLRAHLDRALGAQLRGLSDSVGTHLSSGWDSTAVTATAARLMGARSGRVVAFTAVPGPGAAWRAPKTRHGDEGQLAAIQAALFDNVDHVRVASEARSTLDGFDADDILAGGPVLNPCNRVWASDIDKAARARGISVVLTGDYGNFTLTYRSIKGLRDLAAQRRWVLWYRHARGLVRTGDLRWRGVIAASFEAGGPRALWATLRRLNGEWVSPPGADSALRPALWAAISQGVDAPGNTFERRLASLRWTDTGAALKAPLARYGVDLRSPLADQRLVEFCLAIPWEQVVADGARPSLPHAVLVDRLAPEILRAPTRGYQGVDWHVGLTAARADLTEELDRLEQWAPAAAILDLPRLRRLLRDWPATDWEQQPAITNYRQALHRGVAAGRFARRVTGTNA